ncbi:MAG TPA: discoidin domain-containing protein [Tepidisphaeraceae bacterium]|nr:discoidin domain-containing protein [Tepidisphaeraceae bacterium]
MKQRGEVTDNMGVSLKKMTSVVVILLAAATTLGAAPQSQWVYPGPDGKLVYKTTPAGDRIMDFSYAGYMGGGVALPDVPVAAVVKPGGKDDTAAIEAAIRQVAALPLKNGFHGAVLLAPGTFTCGQTIWIDSSGIVLRGSGSGQDGTTILMTGPRHQAISIGRGRRPYQPLNDEAPDVAPSGVNGQSVGVKTFLADRYVPQGATRFKVASAAGLAIGDTISIGRPVTAAWVKFMGMDNLVRDGKHQTWIARGHVEVQTRRIIAISGNTLTVDMPLADSYDARLLNPPGCWVQKVKQAPAITQVGVEHLHIQCPPLEIAYGNAPYSAVHVGGNDCWVRDIYCQETMNSTVESGKRITIENVRVTHTYPNLGASKPTDFSIEGTQILIDRCKITGDNEYFVWTTDLQPGPNVILNSTFLGRESRVQPHMRWSTGLLVDNCTAPGGGIDFMNRGVAGSGHGWTMGWAVAWNCIAQTYTIENPPGAANWAIGCIGSPLIIPRYFDSGPVMPAGIFDSPETPVAPQSLYLAQLQQRLGAKAIENIGYASNTLAMFPDKATKPLPPWPEQVDPILGVNLAFHRPVNANSVRGKLLQFAGENAVNGDPNKYWMMNDRIPYAQIVVDVAGPVAINAVELREPPGMLGRVQQYRVEGQVNSGWKLLSQGTAIGDRRIDRFPPATVWKVRLTITKAAVTPGIRQFGVYFEKRSGPQGAAAAAQ